MDLHTITQEIFRMVYHDENISLPYIIEREGKEHLAYFVFTCTDTDDSILEITGIQKLIIFNCDTATCSLETEIPAINFPVTIHAADSATYEDAVCFEEKYLDSIQNFLNHQFSVQQYCMAASDILPQKLRNIYTILGAKYLS